MCVCVMCVCYEVPFVLYKHMDEPNTILKFNILNLIQIEIHIYVYKVVA